MKKLLICLALLCIFPLIFSACFSKRNGGSDDPGDFADHGGAPMEFQHFSMSESWDNTVSGNVSRHYRKSPRCERV